MLKKYVFNKYYTKKFEMGGVANAYTFEIPQHDEFYLISEFRQAFKLFGLTVNIPVDVTTFHIPAEFTHILHMWRELSGTDDGMSSDSLDEFITNGSKTFKVAYKDMLKQISALPDTNQQDILTKRLNKQRDKVETLYAKWDKKERQANASFINSGYVPMYKVDHGSTSTYYLGSYIEDRLVLISAEYMVFKGNLVLQLVKQTYMTDDMMMAYFANQEKGVK